MHWFPTYEINPWKHELLEMFEDLYLILIILKGIESYKNQNPLNGRIKKKIIR